MLTKVFYSSFPLDSQEEVEYLKSEDIVVIDDGAGRFILSPGVEFDDRCGDYEVKS